jgi:hypothetical protein
MNKIFWILFVAGSVFIIFLGFRNFGLYSNLQVANWIKYLWLGAGAIGLLAFFRLIKDGYDQGYLE